MPGEREMSSEKKLISACLRGEREAQRALYMEHKDRLFAVALRYARDRAEAEDILQEGFIKIYRDLKDYRPIAPLYAWLRTVVVRTALEHIRKRQRRPQSQALVEDLWDLGEDEQVSDGLQVQALMQLIQALPDDYRLCFNLYAIEGYSHKEIAQQLSISEANSKMRVSRARGILRKHIEKLYEVN